MAVSGSDRPATTGLVGTSPVTACGCHINNSIYLSTVGGARISYMSCPPIPSPGKGGEFSTRTTSRCSLTQIYSDPACKSNKLLLRVILQFWGILLYLSNTLQGRYVGISTTINFRDVPQCLFISKQLPKNRLQVSHALKEPFHENMESKYDLQNKLGNRVNKWPFSVPYLFFQQRESNVTYIPSDLLISWI